VLPRPQRLSSASGSFLSGALRAAPTGPGHASNDDRNEMNSEWKAGKMRPWWSMHPTEHPPSSDWNNIRFSSHMLRDTQSHDNDLKSTLVSAARSLYLTINMAFAASAMFTLALPPSPAYAADSVKIATCLFQKCQIPLLKCVANPKCLANVICINTCNNRPDETECQN
jgi:hypothetical protein